LSLPSGGGGVFNVTGTTTITGISTAQGGRRILLRFAASLQLTHNGTSFILPGAVNITTVAGDVAEFVNEAATDASGSNWRCVNYTRASGSPVNNADFIATQADMEGASSTTALVTAGRARFHPGAVKAWVSFVSRATTGSCTITSSHNVTSVSRGASAGTYTVTFTTAMSRRRLLCRWNGRDSDRSKHFGYQRLASHDNVQHTYAVCQRGHWSGQRNDSRHIHGRSVTPAPLPHLRARGCGWSP
jgi:hypothetical protein